MNAAHYWDQLCTACRAEILDRMGFLNPIYRHYRFEDFQPHSQRDIAAELSRPLPTSSTRHNCNSTNAGNKNRRDNPPTG